MVVLMCGAKSPTSQSSAIRELAVLCSQMVHSRHALSEPCRPRAEEESPISGGINEAGDSQGIASRSFALVVLLGAAWHAIAQDGNAAYPSMAPVDQYLMADRSSEIALAQSAALGSISGDAGVLVLGRH